MIFADCVSQNGINKIYDNAFIRKFRRLNSRLHYGAGWMVVMRIFNSKLPEKKGHSYPYIGLLWQYIATFIRHLPSVRMKLNRIESKISKVNIHWHAWHAFDSKTAEYCVKNTENNHLCSSQTAIWSTDSIRPPSEECSHKGEKDMEKNFRNWRWRQLIRRTVAAVECWINGKYFCHRRVSSKKHLARKSSCCWIA